MVQKKIEKPDEIVYGHGMAVDFEKCISITLPTGIDLDLWTLVGTGRTLA